MSIQAIVWVIECSESTLADRLVLYSIANHCDSSGRSSFPAVATIAKEARISERQVQRSIQNLQTLGELEVHVGAGPRGTHYFVLRKMIRPKCWYCGVDLFMNQMTIDHQNPTSKGGGNELTNLVYACFSCNAQKADRTVQEYRTYRKVPKFFGEAEGRQFVTRPSESGVTSKPKGATSDTQTPDKLSPEPSLTVKELKRSDILFAIKESERTGVPADELLASKRGAVA